jgi:phospholipase/carboxylesterase/glyoxalase family protein
VEDAGFIYEFVPPSEPDPGIVLLLLHGTGGDERDLLPLGNELMPGAALLSPRGRVLERGMPRFFRRLAEGVFDVEDVKFRANELNEFVSSAVDRHRVQDSRVVAVGYSNGANIAASLLLLHPRLLSGAVLFRAMVPLEPDVPPDLSQVRVLLTSGTRDPMVPLSGAEKLKALLQRFGADVEVFWHEGGHELGRDDLTAARKWLTRYFPSAAAERPGLPAQDTRE